ncbi:AraC family transcriptional regulator [Pseudoxanthomonas daejeonensis]|uniref:AraC family transcriptional regulator n=1 Tax=Pseudoxanthomonas daejeonensis TaxID=266062 RepID=A0ABQ6Z7M4_9GAMM|nr:AraC family transcriptional regulator [Pseudoxanthomonas daejeonensis]KAF1694998.1 AraC family transcriptional regulator [Pseudoxanthomonas daejeonensis]
MDALSEILGVVQLSGAFFVNARFSAPWCYQSPAAARAAPWLDPCAEQVVIFHLITEGECLVEMEGAEPLPVRTGDVLLFPTGCAHRMASEAGLPSPRREADLERLLSSRPRRLAYGGGGAATRMVCGYLACDVRLARLLLNGLPPVVQVGLRGSAAGAWLESSVHYALAEARTPRAGSAGLQARLAELLFIEVLRQHVHNEETRGGWLAGLGDRIVGNALNALHQRPGHEWSLAELARAAGTSRTVLAERFQQLVGTSPMQYLTQWRMLMAANLLRRGNIPLSRVAEEVGYQNDTSFSRAFRREYGQPPAAWRRTTFQQGIAANAAP